MNYRTLSRFRALPIITPTVSELFAKVQINVSLEESHILDCDAVLTDGYFVPLQMVAFPSSSGSISPRTVFRLKKAC